MAKTEPRVFTKEIIPDDAQPIIDRAALKESSDAFIEAARQPQQIQTANVQVPYVEPAQPKGLVSVPLPDGRTLTIGPPRFAISSKIAGMQRDFTSMNPLVYSEDKMACRALLYVRAIDGQTVESPHDPISRDFLEQDLGIDGVDTLMEAWFQHFPPITLKTVQTDIKKQ